MLYDSVTDIGLPQVPSNVNNELVQRELDLIYQALHNINAALIGGASGTPGIGDVVSDSAVSALNGLVVYSSLDGKHISITTSSGIPLLINGVLSIATPGVGNDYLAGTTQHNDIQGINAGDIQHLTAAVKTDLTDGNVTSLHKHETTGVNYPAALTIGSPTHISHLQSILDHSWSAGIVDGCDITDNGDGTVSTGIGNATLRAAADPHSPLYNVAIPQQLNIALTDDATNYICLDYNAGAPTFVVSTDISLLNGMNHIIGWVVHRAGTVLHILDARNINVDNARKSAHMFLDYARFIHASGGTALGNPSTTTVSVTAGHFYFMLNEILHDTFDTSVAGTANANVFTLWNHVAGVYTETVNQKTVGTLLYDNGTGTTALGNNKFGVTWFYIINDAPSELHAIMGQAEYPNQAAAEVATPPASTPSLIDGLGVLIGFVVYEKGAATFVNIKSAFATQFGSTGAFAHNGLSGIQGGEINGNYHLPSDSYLLAINFNYRAFSAAQG